VLSAFLDDGEVLGHAAMGIVLLQAGRTERGVPGGRVAAR
jgi:hypothetical protein